MTGSLTVSPPLTWTRVERTEPYTLVAWHLTRLSCRSLRHRSAEKGWNWRDPLARLETIPGWGERGVPSWLNQDTVG